MSKKKAKKQRKEKKPSIDWKTLIISAILDFIVSLIMFFISKLFE